MGVFSDIQKLLDSKLKLTPSSPYVAWPNAEFKPGNLNLTSYVRPTLLLASTELDTLNSENRIPGIYQIDIYSKLDRGVGVVHSLADEIKEHFEENRVLSTTDTKLIVQGVSLGPEAREEAWYRTFLQISFIVYN